MFTTKNIYRNSWLLHLIVWLGVFCACTDIDDEPTMVKTRSLTISRVAIADEANVETARVLVFNESKNLVSNSGCLTVNESMISGNILTIEKETIIANIGTNYIYVILNEGTAGFTDDTFSAVTTIELMEQLRAEPIEYKDLIKVNASDEEPAFLMCVYDEIEVTSATTSLNITGLGGNKGFSMRRTMAKIVLESVVGGVKPDGTIVGTTDQKWQGGDDLYVGEANQNEELIATSAIHILGIDLINVPTHYSWKQEKELSNYPKYEGAYRQDPIQLAVSEFQQNNGYYGREWPGSITVSGTVPFTRVDKISDIWKIEGGSGTNAYTTIDPNADDQDPAIYYIFTKDNKAHETNVHNEKLTDLSVDKYDKDNYNYDHYSIEGGNIILWKKDGEELTDAPNNQVYTLNSGNFTTWFKDTYNKDFSLSQPGTPVAGAPEADNLSIKPAVWTLNFNNRSYYIPENIPEDTDNYTKLRITASIAIPTAVLDPVKVQEAIKDLADKGETGDLVQDETVIEYTDDNILKYMWAKGELVPHKNDPNIFALKYTGLSRIFAGSVAVGESDGQYDAITGMMATKVTIEIPLNNDMVEGNYNENDYAENTYVGNEKPDGADDHNIYRGREYHVKLYVTKQGAWNNQTNTASRTIDIGGEELTITGKVVTKLMK